MGEPFLAEIRLVSFNFAPRGWAFCNGQLLPINQNQALFSLLGTTYGGDGRTTFALPDLRGRTPFHVGGGIALGQRGGEERHTLTVSELPHHPHPVIASSNAADQPSPANRFWARVSQPAYAGSGAAAMSPAAVSQAGGGQSHENMSPVLVLTHIIALQGIFPSRN